jgi:hypothetical protein
MRDVMGITVDVNLENSDGNDYIEITVPWGICYTSTKKRYKEWKIKYITS